MIERGEQETAPQWHLPWMFMELPQIQGLGSTMAIPAFSSITTPDQYILNARFLMYAQGTTCSGYVLLASGVLTSI